GGALGERRIVDEPRGLEEMRRRVLELLGFERDLAAQRVSVDFDTASLSLARGAGAAGGAGDQREVPGMLHISVQINSGPLQRGPPAMGRPPHYTPANGP